MSTYDVLIILKIIGPKEYEKFLEYVEMKFLTISNATLEFALLFRNVKKTDIETTYQDKAIKLFNDKQLRDRKSDLCIALKKFLFLRSCVKQLEKDAIPDFTMMINFILGEIFRNLKHFSMYKKHFKNILKAPDDLSLNSISTKMIYYLSEISYDIYEVSYNSNRNRNLDNAIWILDILYWSERLKLECENINRSKVLQISNSSMSSIELIQSNEALKNLIVGDKVTNAYYHIYLMLTKNDEKSYEEVFNKIGQYLEIKSVLEKEDIFNYLLNFCIDKVNNNEYLYVTKYLNLIEIMREHKLFLSDGVMDIFRYKTIIDMSLLSEKPISLAKDYLKLFRKFLPEETRELHYDFNNLNIKFSEAMEITINKENRTAQLEEILTTLMCTHGFDVAYKIACNKLIVKCYFSLAILNKNDVYMERAVNAAFNLKKSLQTIIKKKSQGKGKILDFDPLIELMKIIIKYSEKPIGDWPRVHRKIIGELLVKISKPITDINWLINVLSRGK